MDKKDKIELYKQFARTLEIKRLWDLQYTNNPIEGDPMTPNERLLKMAREAINGWEDRTVNGPAFKRLMTELEAAVRECEAVDTLAACGCPTQAPFHTKDCKIKQAMIYGTGVGTVRWTPTPEDGPEPDQLTDQQHKLGLRSTRHMGPDYGNYDYD